LPDRAPVTGLSDRPETSTAPALAPVAMAAAALASGELFRALFADSLPKGRSCPTPFSLDLLTLGKSRDSPPLPEEIELGTIHLAGCGAIGQAAAATLRRLPVSGTLYAVDYDPLDEGNLQRYLLAGASDVGSSKPGLIERTFADHPLRVEPVATKWGADSRTAPGRETVLAALDTKQGRIDLQAGLPREIFNAWTQPADLGVSRHQAFGEAPCLACLGWPDRARPSESELIAGALEEEELRVSLYLGSELPVGAPLPVEQIRGTRRLSLPDDPALWSQRSLLEDLIARFDLPPERLQPLASLGIRALYRDAICAGMLIEHRGRERDDEVSVPLAHQSALAGILLATWLVIDRVPELRALRPSDPVARYDVLSGGEQVWPRPRARAERCFCHDTDFLNAYRERWG
jgi:hypothetical protein